MKKIYINLYKNNLFNFKKMNQPQIQYDQQINFINYIERKNYPFRGGPKNNPLLPLYPIYSSDVILPSPIFSIPERDICTKQIYSLYNRLDKHPVNCVKFFNYSKKVLFGTTNGNLNVCDIYNSFDLHKYYQLDKFPSIRALQFNKDESYLLTGDKIGIISYFKNSVNSHNFESKQTIQLHNDTITDISFSINSLKFVSSSDDKTTKIVDFNTYTNELVFKEHRSDVKSCDWNPYRNVIISAGKDQSVQVWDPSTGKSIGGSLKLHKNSINRVRFNPINGNLFLSGSKDHTVKVSDIRMMKELQTFKGHDSEVNTICWHPVHQEVFCSAGADQKIIYWKVGDEKSFTIKKAHDKEIFDLSFNSNGTLLASGSNDSYLKFWIRDTSGI